MHRRDPESTRTLLPRVLATLAKAHGQGSPLVAVWRDAVGAQFADHFRPLAIADGVLVLEGREAAWNDRLREHEAELCTRLRDRSGLDVRRFEVVPP